MFQKFLPWLLFISMVVIVTYHTEFVTPVSRFVIHPQKQKPYRPFYNGIQHFLQTPDAIIWNVDYKKYKWLYEKHR